MYNVWHCSPTERSERCVEFTPEYFYLVVGLALSSIVTVLGARRFQCVCSHRVDVRVSLRVSVVVPYRRAGGAPCRLVVGVERSSAPAHRELGATRRGPA